MCVPFIVILPGLLGLALLRDPNTGHLLRLVPADVAWFPAGQAQGLHGYDEVLPLMWVAYCGPGLLGLVLPRYRRLHVGHGGKRSQACSPPYGPTTSTGRCCNKNASDESKVRMGRWVTVIGVFISIGTAYLVMQTQSIMDYVQALFQLLHRPALRHGDFGHALETCYPGGRLDGPRSRERCPRLACTPGSKSIRERYGMSLCSMDAQDQAQNMFRALWCCLICVVVTVVERVHAALHDDREDGPEERVGHLPRRAEKTQPRAMAVSTGLKP